MSISHFETPVGDQRKTYVQGMFNAIAHHYDLLNHLLSFGIDILWRRKAISKLQVTRSSRVLDLACGTADFALEILKQKNCRAVGVDIALKMLQQGSTKVKDKPIGLVNGDGENLPFANNTFDGLTIAFGIRNMGDMDSALKEMNRILKPGAQAVILEFSLPTVPLFRSLYLFYFNKILPRIGRMISRDSKAYTYLPASVRDFPSITEFTQKMAAAGYGHIKYWKLLNGVAVIYRATCTG